MEQNIKCCQILGSVAGSFRGSKVRVFAHACAAAALSHEAKLDLYSVQLAAPRSNTNQRMTSFLA